jgi:Phytanoyl-CoA dioxygenase (PhyH)
MLTQEQRVTFDADGVVRLSGAVPGDDARRMADLIRAHLATGARTRQVGEDEVAKDRGVFQPLKRSGAFDAIGAGALPAALDDLLGDGGWERPLHCRRPLVTYTSEGPWDVPTGGWHIHLRPATGEELQTVDVFVVLSELRPRGGGTLFLTGSHRLISQSGEHGSKTSALKRSLGERDRWLAELWATQADQRIDRRRRYLDEGAVVDGVPMRVIEATGRPGDAYLMRSDTFHAAAPNTHDQPRIMLVGGVPRYGRPDQLSQDKSPPSAAP